METCMWKQYNGAGETLAPDSMESTSKRSHMAGRSETSPQSANI